MTASLLCLYKVRGRKTRMRARLYKYISKCIHGGYNRFSLTGGGAVCMQEVGGKERGGEGRGVIVTTLTDQAAV